MNLHAYFKLANIGSRSVSNVYYERISRNSYKKCNLCSILSTMILCVQFKGNTISAWNLLVTKKDVDTSPFPFISLSSYRTPRKKMVFRYYYIQVGRTEGSNILKCGAGPGNGDSCSELSRFPTLNSNCKDLPQVLLFQPWFIFTCV